MRTGTRSSALLILLLAACRDPVSSSSTRDGATAENASAPGDPVLAGEYQTLCAACHGELGEGRSAPALDAWTRPREVLVATIDDRMPLGSPELCDAACAERMADYILNALQRPPTSCASAEPPERTLRLLTRREYRNTVRDLFRLEPTTCRSDADCDLAHQSCAPAGGAAGTCVRDACPRVTFLFDAGGRALQSVWVSGSFNGWAETPAAGAVVLAFEPRLGLWAAKRDLPDGDHTYKFVLDGREWVVDPRNSARVSDGFGGENSRLEVRCSGAPSRPDPGLAGVVDAAAARLPVETRPAGYPFDNFAEAGVVSAVHATESLAAARALSEAALADRDRWFPCRPGEDRRACTTAFVRDFGRRAFRRPLRAEELSKYETLVAGAPTLEAGVARALQVMLASPHFLYRSEIGEPAGAHFALTPWEMASALSYQLWGTMPDDALFAAAERSELATPEGREREALRLLENPRSRDQLAAFALAWLGVEGLREVPKNNAVYPEFDDALRAALLEETRRYFLHVFDGPSPRFESLLTGRTTHVNEALARLYGISGVTGESFVEAPLPASRSGILTLGSVLATYALSDQSSPIKRGVFVRERLLCQKFGVPPPDAGGLPPVDPNATTRERFAMHTQKESCRSCHQYIDPVGFGFERFDGSGRYREFEAGRPIDASGNMNDVDGLGTRTDAPFETVPELGAALAASRGAADCFVTQYWRFAQGAQETSRDRCALETLEANFQASGGDLRALILDVVRAPEFAQRRSP